jgi:hypothetical protein
MGTGTLTLHTRRLFARPVLLVGEIAGGRWKQYAAHPVASKDGGLTISVANEHALSMLLLCEEADREATVGEMERWMQTPWKLEERR